MWKSTYSRTVTGIAVERLWQLWTDVNQWSTWQTDIESASMEGHFAAGNKFRLKPRGGPSVNIEIVNVVPNRRFTDLTRFPGAGMYGDHEFIQHGDELEIRTTMSIEGPLSFVWRKIVAEGVAKGAPQQTDMLLARAANG